MGGLTSLETPTARPGFLLGGPNYAQHQNVLVADCLPGTRETKAVNALTKLNALRRLTLKLHGESPKVGGRRDWNTRVYDGENLIGCVEWCDLAGAMDEYKSIKSMFPDGGNDNITPEQRQVRWLQARVEELEFEVSYHFRQSNIGHRALVGMAGDAAEAALEEMMRTRPELEEKRRKRKAREQAKK